MEMTGEYRIPAPRERVWEALNDPAVLKSCIPGCESLEMTSPTEMTAAVTAKVGPVKAKFTGAVTLSNIHAPERYTISGEGKGGVAGFAKGGADVDLEPDGDATILRYTARAQVGGKLAQLGSRLIDSTAKKMADDFFGAFSATLGGTATGGSVPTTDDPAIAVEPVRIDANGNRLEIADAAVVDEIYDEAENVLAEAEEKVEAAAERAFLGGPVAWGFIAVAIVILLIAIFH
ncbi:SRPBCC family protein [Segnochrobactrum spirostomi]|uniref:Carbon monoxide dehydrogenase subunit G n=1 Tax=Segnochrobactrum spirostomi TaxID=2608987 RepID=A0A6A7Y0X1_9HYPH|nr:carbon monoxide dehydrogenase subunit G [Segnochrobactrum spirostomi]MQT11751.1 carbon monoxide dehydrogenase subunit G [Segnochrobactrum spirostomi]